MSGTAEQVLLGVPWRCPHSAEGNPIAGNSMASTVVPVNGAGGTLPVGLSSGTLTANGKGYATDTTRATANQIAFNKISVNWRVPSTIKSP
jgi:hypothetical protein